MIAIIMGSKSDYEVMEPAWTILEELRIPFVKRVISAHRTPDLMFEFAKGAKKDGIDVIIAGAGGAAHVPGMVAAITNVPVIGVPIWTKDFGGNDALMSIVQMPGGIPVATVGINRSLNAGLLAARMIAMSDNTVYKKLEAYQEKMKQKVLDTQI